MSTGMAYDCHRDTECSQSVNTSECLTGIENSDTGRSAILVSVPRGKWWFGYMDKVFSKTVGEPSDEVNLVEAVDLHQRVNEHYV